MRDTFTGNKPIKSSRPDAGGANLRNVPVIGIVKDNIDPTRSGRLRVYISDFSSEDPDNSKSWVTVSYMTPFYGVVEATSADDDFGTYKTNSSSYGLWNSPPDLGSKVICIFINGDPTYGYYIGCIPKQEALHMVPAIAASTNIVPNEGEAQSLGGAIRLPVSNMNTNNAVLANGSNFLNVSKPIHSFQAAIMTQQGIIRDPVRGPISSSANRESPSRVGWGVSTPGRPIYEGGYTDETVTDAAGNSSQQTGLKVTSRRGGHSIVMDDGDLIGQDQLVRIRTALGHQIMMSDSGQTLMILHSNGQSYIELGKEGTIDMYSTNSVNIRTQGDLNLHADNDINIHAMKKLNIQAEIINVNSEKDFNQKVGTNHSSYTMGKYTHKVDAAMSMEAGGEASYASSSTTYINGSRINLNTGSTGTTPETVAPIPIQAHTDTLSDSTKGFAAAPGKLLSIVSRAPAHAPWANAGQGVDVKTSTNASSELPAPPAPAVAAVSNAAASSDLTSQVTVPGAATMPPVTAISGALDKGTTSAMVGAVAKNAAVGPAAAAVAAGSGIVQTESGAVASVGALAMTPKQLETAGIIKPQSAALVNGLISGGKTIEQALTSNLFTGKPGAENLPAVVQNVGVQVAAQVTNFQSAQTALTAAGAMTGKEAPGAVAGVVMSGATAGLNQTLDAVKTVGNSVLAGASKLAGSASSVVNAINSGNFAAGISQTVTGGLGSISAALGSMGKAAGLSSLLDAAKGVAGSAFAAITKAFAPLKAGVPQDLTAIAAAKAAGAAATNAASAVASATGNTGGLTGALTTIGSAVGGVVGNVVSAGSGLLAKAGNLVSSFGSAGSVSSASAIASGVEALPGGSKTISSVINNAAGAVNNIPGTDGIKSLINNSVTSATNGISLDKSFAAAGAVGTNLAAGASNLVSGAASAAASAATGALDKLKSGASSLASLATTGLSPDAASQVNSAMASLSSASGSSSIKLPTVGENTSNRSEIDATTDSILGGGITKPNFTGTIQSGIKSALAALDKKRAELIASAEALATANSEADAAKAALETAKNNLPAGDPQIAALTQALNDKVATASNLTSKVLGASTTIAAASTNASINEGLTKAFGIPAGAVVTAPPPPNSNMI